jgi:LPXTG-motif cell wall-anchored protein
MKTRLAAALAGLGLALAAGLVALAAPAAATETQNEPVCATWTMRGATGKYPAVVWGGAPDGSSVTKTSAKLVKPEAAEGEEPLVDPGVEFVTKGLMIQAPEGDEIHVKVKYELADGASVSAGAVRMFGYAAQNADTLTAVDYGNSGGAVATNETGGNLVFQIPAGKELGTLAVVYDASNSAKGSVTFSDMEIDGRPVWFTACPEPEPTVTATPTAQPTQTATPDPGGTATPEPTESAAPVPTLPVTGSTPLMFVLAGAFALGSGGLLVTLARRRRTTFRS